jgi:hypothetical protein
MEKGNIIVLLLQISSVNIVTVPELRSAAFVMAKAIVSLSFWLQEYVIFAVRKRYGESNLISTQDGKING